MTSVESTKSSSSGMAAGAIPAKTSVPGEKRIAFCTDFSSVAETALQEVLRLCKRDAASLTLLHVFEHDDLSECAAAEIAEIAWRMESARNKLDQLRDKVAEEHIVVTARLLDGDACHAILEEMEEETPSLLVMATRGRRGWNRLVFGSTTETVVRSVPCPVMTVGPSMDATSQLNGPVIFATDLQGGDEETVEYALGVARQAGVPLHAVHVLPATVKREDAPSVSAIMLDALRSLTMKEGRGGSSSICEVLFGSDVSRAIVEYAKAHHAQAIVLGVQKRARLASHLAAHRTFRVLVDAPCPVYTLAHEKHTIPLRMAASA